MHKRTTDFRQDLLADLADPQEAAHYLNAAFEDSAEMVLVALRDVAEARQMVRVAEGAGVAREALYRMLRKSGNPTYNSFVGVLNAIGVRIVFEPMRPPEVPEERFGVGIGTKPNTAPMPATAIGNKRSRRSGDNRPRTKKRG
jgi:probable addiction module antidote protein